MQKYPTQNYIAGEWFAKGEDFFEVFDKYNQHLLSKLPLANADQIELAICSALQAFDIYKHWSAGKKAKHLEKLADLLAHQKEKLADLIAAEAGKPISFAKTEIERCLITLRTAAAETLRFAGEIVPIDFANGEGKTAFTKRFPVGVIACISPFNFPLNLALHKIAPALAVGCTLILKPSPFAPLSALAFAELFEQANYPSGTLNVLNTSNLQAEKLVTDSRIKMFSFTGSPQIGWQLKNLAGKKKVTLELGGNAAVIIDSSADFASTAKSLATACFLYAGQICISTQRIYVLEDVFEEFCKLLISETQQILSGDPRNPNVINSSMIDQKHLKRVNQWVKEAENLGAKILCGGKILDKKHNLYAPTLITNTNKLMKVVSEEVFAPVAIIEKVQNFAQAIDLVNDSDFGLQASIFTNRLDQMKEAHEKLEVAGVLINTVTAFRTDNMPYGGIKNSGFGREGIKYAMQEMSEGKLLIY